MENLHITLFQSPLHWHNPVANRAMFEEKIWQITEPTDLIILPEMFTTGFTMSAADYAEMMGMDTLKWMQQMAAHAKAVVTGSFIVKEKSNFYNRLLWVEPDGSYDYYDKRHLFRMAQEDKTYTAGTKNIIKEIKSWKIMPQVCYDVRFPVWSRNTNLDYDVLLYVANFPQARVQAWSVLLQARAIENLCYVVGVNRVGTDGLGIDYSGESAIVNYKGERLYHQEHKEETKQYSLNKEELLEFRKKFPANLDADQFTILV